MDIKEEVAKILKMAQQPRATEGCISFEKFWAEQIHDLYLAWFKEQNSLKGY